MKCKSCKGTGKMVITATEITAAGAKEMPSVSIDCIRCNGSGEISAARQKQLEAQAALWCKCGNPSGNSQFFNDGEHPNCSKHCYVCEDCRKITQVG